MSIKIMTRVFEKSKTRQGARLVLLALADNASDEGICYPAVATIARKAGLSEQVTREYLHAFERMGLMAISTRTDENDRQCSNLYELCIEKIGDDSIPPDILQAVKPPSRKRPALSPGLDPSNPGETGEGLPVLEGGGSNTGERRIIIKNHQIEPSSIVPAAKRGHKRPEEAALEARFSELTGLPIPQPNTTREKGAAAARWYQPIRRMVKLADGTSTDLLRQAVEHMRRDHLTITAPQSVESVFIALYGEQRSAPTVQLTAKQLAAQQGAYDHYRGPND